MKLIYETEVANFEVEEFFNESTGSTSKKYKIKGVFSTIGERNKNGRIYPRNIWETQVAKYQDELANGSSNCLMELEHPARTTVDMMEAVARIEKLYIKDKYVMGEAFLLNNPKANQLKALIDAGITMSVSSRGVGKVGRDNIVEDFKLVTYDVISNQNQSDYNARMQGIVEGVLEDKSFEITESGSIEEVQVCTKDACHLFETKDIQKVALEKFKNLLEELSTSSASDRISSKSVNATFTDEKGKIQKKTFESEQAARSYANLMHWKFEYSDGSGIN